jgi:hypothetical protein
MRGGFYSCVAYSPPPPSASSSSLPLRLRARRIVSQRKVERWADLPPFLDFCDELRYHYGSETAVFFAFAAFCFRQLLWLTLVAMYVVVVTFSSLS